MRKLTEVWHPVAAHCPWSAWDAVVVHDEAAKRIVITGVDIDGISKRATFDDRWLVVEYDMVAP